MSSTSAVSVLAQGLRELRDFAEGPDGEELRERTGLTAEQIDAALAGERLPTREVTLALVEAWDGDVEAWRGYWGQIEELAEQDEAGHAKTTPAPPEPSIITPMVTEGAGEGEPERESATEEREPAAAEQGLATAEHEEQEEQSKAEGAEAEQAEGHQEEDTEVEQADAENGETEPVAAEPAASDQSTAKAQAPAAASAESPAAEPQPAKSSFLTRIGIPILVFAIGAGVGAFADHALNSKQTSTNSAASLPPVSSSARSSHTVALSPSGSGGSPSSSASSPAASGAGSGPTSATDTTPTGTSAPADTANSATSTVAAGTVLGAYVNIQLASGYSVNFLSDAYHPAPGTANGPDTMGFFAGSFVDGRFYADRVAILDPTDTGSYTSCLNDTRYQHDVLLSQIATDSSFCITTGTGHLVLVTVRRMPSSTDANPYAVLDVTVWQTS